MTKPDPMPLSAQTSNPALRKATQEPPDRFVREAERELITGASRSTWWRWEREGLAPKRVPLGANSVGWPLSALMRWQAERIKAAAEKAA